MTGLRREVLIGLSSYAAYLAVRRVVWTDAADWTSRLDRLAEAVAGRRSGGPTEGR